jgi:flagellar biosynthesis protein FlhB
MPGERTEQATPQRREKARRDGDVLRSRELSSASGMLAGVLCLGLMGQRVLDGFRSLFVAVMEEGSMNRLDGAALKQSTLAMRRPLIEASVPVGIMMAAIAGASILCGLIQGGGLQVSGKALGPNLNRLSPITNAKNVFSLRAAARVGKSVLPAAVLAVLAFQRIAHQLSVPAFSSRRLVMLAGDLYGLLAATAWLLLGWALIDYAIEWRSRETRLMMSREEMKQEFKEMEGSPQTRSRIRGLQRQMRRRKMKSDIAKAAVVLTNPTHYAVALEFDFAIMEAPRVLAKGRNLLAEEIKTEARWAGVPIIENPPLARSLYRWVEVGQAIPADLYAAVAAILAYLYRQRVEEEMRAKRARQARDVAKGRTPSTSSESLGNKGQIDRPNSGNHKGER